MPPERGNQPHSRGILLHASQLRNALLKDKLSVQDFRFQEALGDAQGFATGQVFATMRPYSPTLKAWRVGQHECKGDLWNHSCKPSALLSSTFRSFSNSGDVTGQNFRPSSISVI